MLWLKRQSLYWHPINCVNKQFNTLITSYIRRVIFLSEQSQLGVRRLFDPCSDVLLPRVTESVSECQQSESARASWADEIIAVSVKKLVRARRASTIFIKCKWQSKFEFLLQTISVRSISECHKQTWRLWHLTEASGAGWLCSPASWVTSSGTASCTGEGVQSVWWIL